MRMAKVGIGNSMFHQSHTTEQAETCGRKGCAAAEKQEESVNGEIVMMLLFTIFGSVLRHAIMVMLSSLVAFVTLLALLEREKGL